MLEPYILSIYFQTEPLMNLQNVALVLLLEAAFLFGLYRFVNPHY